MCLSLLCFTTIFSLKKQFQTISKSTFVAYLLRRMQMVQHFNINCLLPTLFESFSLLVFYFVRSKCTELDLSHKHHRMYAKLLENSIAACFVYILVFVPHTYIDATHLKRTQLSDFDETGRCFEYFPLFYMQHRF